MTHVLIAILILLVAASIYIAGVLSGANVHTAIKALVARAERIAAALEAVVAHLEGGAKTAPAKKAAK